MSQNLERLDSNFAVYLEPTDDRALDQKMMRRVCEYCVAHASGTNVLEMGVGDQIMTPILLNSYSNVTTIDGSQTLLNAMQNQLTDNPRWSGVCSLFEEYVPEEKFDLIFCTYVLEHVEQPQTLLIRMVENWLAANGKIVIVVPHSMSIHRRLAQTMGMISYLSELGDTDKVLDHFHCFSYLDIERLLSLCELRILERAGLFCKPLPNRYLTKLSDLQLDGLFKLGLDLPIELAASIFYLVEPKN